MTREEAGAAVGVSRKLAAFHLDKLVRAGLLVNQTPPDSEGRRGRRPHRYALATTEVAVAIPPRKPALLAQLLLEAILSDTEGEAPTQAALRIANEHGRALGAGERNARSRGRLGPERALTLLAEVLERHGYDMIRASSSSRQFRSCPFHPLAQDNPDVVCRIHHAYVAGVADGLEAAVVETAFAPGTQGCCVQLRTT